MMLEEKSAPVRRIVPAAGLFHAIAPVVELVGLRPPGAAEPAAPAAGIVPMRQRLEATATTPVGPDLAMPPLKDWLNPPEAWDKALLILVNPAFAMPY